MENKYYTPKIEEFHVGFAYEFKHYDDESNTWIKYNTPQFNHELEDFCLSKSGREFFRVRYLDREDIESEGWEFKRDEGLNGIVFKLLRMPKIELRFNIREEYICITRFKAIRGYVDEEALGLFIGNIKNLSEFRKLQIQLGIESWN